MVVKEPRLSKRHRSDISSDECKPEGASAPDPTDAILLVVKQNKDLKRQLSAILPGLTVIYEKAHQLIITLESMLQGSGAVVRAPRVRIRSGRVQGAAAAAAAAAGGGGGGEGGGESSDCNKSWIVPEHTTNPYRAVDDNPGFTAPLGKRLKESQL